MMNKPLFIIAIVLIAVRQLSASSATEIIISIPDQTLAVVDSGKLFAGIGFPLPSSATAIMLAAIGHRSARSSFRGNLEIIYRLAQ